jgi:hypothetical protein
VLANINKPAKQKRLFLIYNTVGLNGLVKGLW